MTNNLDISSTLVGNTDRLDAASLPEPRTITISNVKIGQDEKKRPNIILNFEGDEGLPFIPCLSMRRVLARCWGKNASSYVGRQITVYNDPDVTFGGQATGGVRISHLSDIDKEIVVNLRKNRKQISPFTVKPIQKTPVPQNDCQNERPQAKKETDERRERYEQSVAKLKGIFEGKTSKDELQKFMATPAMNKFMHTLTTDFPDLEKKVSAVYNQRQTELLQKEEG